MKKLLLLPILISSAAFAQLDSATFVTGSSFILENVTFTPGKAGFPRNDSLTVVIWKELDKFVSVIKEHDLISIEIIGHTDPIGNKKKNLTLSIERAKLIRAILLSKGISSKRVTAIGKGGLEPIVPGRSRRNRRIEVRVSKGETD